jgi:hypothetical protein
MGKCTNIYCDSPHVHYRGGPVSATAQLLSLLLQAHRLLSRLRLLKVLLALGLQTPVVAAAVRAAGLQGWIRRTMALLPPGSGKISASSAFRDTQQPEPVSRSYHALPQCRSAKVIWFGSHGVSTGWTCFAARVDSSAGLKLRPAHPAQVGSNIIIRWPGLR